MTATIDAPSKARLAEIARTAADILAERGKCVSTLQSEDGRVCMWGALQLATIGHIDYAEPPVLGSGAPGNADLSALRREIQEALPAERYNNIWPGQDFSDHSHTDTVISFLHDLADRLDPQV